MFDRFKQTIGSNTCVSVWPTDDAVATAVVKHKRKGLPLLETCEYQPIKNRVEQTGLLKKLLEQNGLDKYRCVSLMSTDTYDLLMVEAPDVPEEELVEAMRWRVKDMIDFPIEKAVIDVFDIPDQKSSNDMMYVVVAREEVIAKRVKLMLDSGFDLNAIDIMELAMRNVTSLLPENEQGVAMVWLGLHSGSITLTRNGVLYFTRHLIGSEKLFGTLYSESVTRDMEGWLDTVVIEIQRTLDFYESQYQQPPAAGVVLVPLVKPIDGLTDYLSSQLGVPVRYLELNNLFEISEDIELEKIALCLPAIGAALNLAETTK